MEISIETDIPIARGLGSSASLVISLTGGLLYGLNEKYALNFSKEAIEEMINSLGYELEALFHGNPSGIDHMTSLKGNCVLFQKNKAMTLLPADFLELFDLYLIDSGVPKNTKKAVKQVADYLSDPFMGSIYGRIIDTMGAITEKCVALLSNAIHFEVEEKMNYFQQLIRLNHAQLVDLDLSHDRIDQLMAILNKHQLVGKITGAG